jgi:DNA-directed RNA polymerase subunit beta
VNYLASNARVNEFGFLEAPYFKVVKGVVTKELVWLDAFEEQQYNIAQSDSPLNEKFEITNERVTVRMKGEPALCDRNDVHYMDVTPSQSVSVSASLVPFLGHNDANRVLMASNMQRQAVPPILPEPPLVGTGHEDKAAQDSAQVLVSDVAGTVSEVDGQSISVKTESGTKVYSLSKFKRSNQSTCLSQRPLVSLGDKVKKGSVLADGSATAGGVLSLGKNLLVAFLPWHGGNFEDANILHLILT